MITRQPPQTDPPRSPRETLPTMYDLPSEDPNEPGLPDEYHSLQPQLLSATLRLPSYAADQVFSVGDMNLYYDVRHPLWHKGPDWFLVLGVPRLYDEQDLRRPWLRWYDAEGNWTPTEGEVAEQERRQKERLAERLRAMDIDSEQILNEPTE